MGADCFPTCWRTTKRSLLREKLRERRWRLATHLQQPLSSSSWQLQVDQRWTLRLQDKKGKRNQCCMLPGRQATCLTLQEHDHCGQQRWSPAVVDDWAGGRNGG